jgi:hypothetical protein
MRVEEVVLGIIDFGTSEYSKEDTFVEVKNGLQYFLLSVQSMQFSLHFMKPLSCK